MKAHQHQLPRDEQGIIGDVLNFTVRDVDWRAFEFRSPSDPATPARLILIARHQSYEVEDFPRDWRTAPAEQLTELAAKVSPRPIRRSAPTRADRRYEDELERLLVEALTRCLAELDVQRSVEGVRLPPEPLLAELRNRVHEFTARAHEPGYRLEHAVCALSGLLDSVRPTWAFDESLRALALGWCVDRYHDEPRGRCR